MPKPELKPVICANGHELDPDYSGTACIHCFSWLPPEAFKAIWHNRKLPRKKKAKQD